MKLARAIRTGSAPIGGDGMRRDTNFEYEGLDAPEYTPAGSIEANGSWMFDTGLSRWPASFGCWAKPCPEWTEVLNIQDEEETPEVFTVHWGDSTGVHRVRTSSYIEAVSVACAMQKYHNCCGGIRHPDGKIAFEWYHPIQDYKLQKHDYEA